MYEEDEHNSFNVGMDTGAGLNKLVAPFWTWNVNLSCLLRVSLLLIRDLCVFVFIFIFYF